MKIHALGTHSDWVYNGGAWGRAGHQRIADLTYAAGIRRLYWRTHNGGQAKYPSKACSISDGTHFRDPNFQGLGSLPKSYFAYMTSLDYREWDQVTDMYEIGTEVGLEVCHWYTVYEDDHGGHLYSDYLKKHPEYRCTLRSGEQVPGCLDFWYPEVREYKLGIIDELLEKPTSRMLLDFLRRNGKPSADANGHFRYGYNPEILAGFKSETGLDATRLQPGTPDWETWLDYNARPLTEFLRKVHVRAKAKGVPLDLLTWAVDTRHWQALDLPTILAEGLAESLLTGTHRYAFSAADARRQVTQMRESLGPGSPTPILPGLFCYNQFPPRSVDEFIQEAETLGCDTIVLHEANHVVECPITDTVRSWHLGKPHVKREILASGEGTTPQTYEGFIPCHDITGRTCDQLTKLSASYDAVALTITVTCMERAPEKLLPVPGIGKENYNGNQLKARAFWSPFESVQVLLDASHGHEDYFHFVIDPSGETMTEQRLDEDWSGDWQGTAHIGAQEWTATFRLPWSSLGVEPSPGRQMGLQVVRMQNSPRELSAWFCATGRRINPLELGHLRLS